MSQRQQGVSYRKLLRETRSTLKANRPSQVLPSLPFPRLPPPDPLLPQLPLTSPSKSHYTSSLVPGASGHTLTSPGSLGHDRKTILQSHHSQKLTRAPHPHSHPLGPEGTAIPQVAELGNSEGGKGARVVARHSSPRLCLPVPSPAPCSAGCWPCRPGLLRGLAQDGSAGRGRSSPE